MKYLRLVALCTALCFPLLGCGGEEAGAPETIDAKPAGDDMFKASGDDLQDKDGNSALEAPPLDINTEPGGPGGGN